MLRSEPPVQSISRESNQYPELLRAIASPPAQLFVRGNIQALHQPGIAIVGTRRPSVYGLDMTTRIAGQLAESGICIISGLAYGIDAAAHEAALARGGTTVAVMGTGIDQVYPFEHRDLAERIVASGGAIVTEFPVGMSPLRQNFPQRNRILAGLARAVWLVEAPERSGALITMRFGLDENRDLYALPGDANRPTAHGALNWLRLGAAVGAKLEDFQATFPGLSPELPDSKLAIANIRINADERIVIDLLAQTEPRHIDEITEACRLEASVIAATLALLEVRGLVRHHGDMRYTRLT